MNRLFQPKEQFAVEDAFADNLLFATMRGASLRLYNQSRDTALNHSELFYQVVCTLDIIKSKSPVEIRNYCSHVLWDELIDYLMVERDTDDKMSIQKNVTAIMSVTAVLLIWSNESSLTSISSFLLLNPQHEAPAYTQEVLRQFRLSFRDANQEALSKYIADYMQSEELLSEQMNELLDNLPEDNEEPQPTADSGIRLAEGKLTPFIFAMEAMYKADWFVDSNGKPIRAKDKAAKSILQRVFGIEKPNISQLRSAAKNRNMKEPYQYLEELVEQLK